MKKIIIVLVLIMIMLISSTLCIISYNRYQNTKKKNIDLEEKIKNITVNNKNKEEENATLNDSIVKLQEELKEEIEKYNQWLKIKENLILASY